LPGENWTLFGGGKRRSLRERNLSFGGFMFSSIFCSIFGLVFGAEASRAGKICEKLSGASAIGRKGRPLEMVAELRGGAHRKLHRKRARHTLAGQINKQKQIMNHTSAYSLAA